MKKILIINGPNLNLLGTREPQVYGNRSFDDYLKELKSEFPKVEIEYFQSNHEGELIDKIQNGSSTANGLVINGGGLSHTSISLADALTAVYIPSVEVHISNIYGREAYRHHSFLTSRCKGIISGLGLAGYGLAVRYLLESE